MSLELARTRHHNVHIDGVDIFYRESVPERADAPVLLLLHGFPSASHQFRRLIDVLGTTYHLVAPDYPGFGYTQTPDDFDYSFDRLADVIEDFVGHLGLDRFTMYMFDFGAPVGFRLAIRQPDRISGLIVQNGNAYEEGLTDEARAFIGLRQDMDGAEAEIREMLTLQGTRAQYESGVRSPEALTPDSWTLDHHFLDAPGRVQAQIDLAFDYHSNLELYADWQEWLRMNTPPTLVLWGGRDPFFSTPGAFAYLRDVPDAELHVFPTGHFALEEQLNAIAPLVGSFLEQLDGGA